MAKCLTRKNALTYLSKSVNNDKKSFVEFVIEMK
jgi:hypothetical protein